MTTADSGDLTFEFDERGARYVARLGDRIAGEIDFSLRDGTMIIVHTGTRPEFRGRGFAAKLTRHALDDVRTRGLRVVPECPFTAQFIADNPEYADLLA
jgi:predicted GNAT family acetyltransferase